MGFIEAIKWRGMIHDIMPGTETLLEREITTAYVGFDPTADSLHIGHLVSVMMLKHLQLAGHKPIALVGGATGMIGDPSGRSEERKLLDEDVLHHNQACIERQLLKFLDFDKQTKNRARMVNNYDWMKGYNFLEFVREVGKHISVNYMLAKDSVKNRLESGLSFTEFSYQLVQAYDFYYLYEHYQCKLQMGGSDQWGNITTGTELIRRKAGGEAFALTCPLITRGDGGKFGKTEEGNVWLDPRYTSPYKFYQFWLNVSDEDAEKYIKIFTLMEKTEIQALVKAHKQTPHTRILQNRLAKEITQTVHSTADFETVSKASQILFGKSTKEALSSFSTEDLLMVFEGVPQPEVTRSALQGGVNVIDLLAVKTGVFASKGEARRMVKGGGLLINKEKISDPDYRVTADHLLNGKFLLIQKGKKNYYLLTVR
jgi:tyrosyl-tRNA synthetase